MVDRTPIKCTVGVGSNLPVLQQNTLAGFSETAGYLYLTLLDAFQGWNSLNGERRAFLAATNYHEQAGDTLDYILRNSPAHDLTTDTITQLSHFSAERWRHNFMEAASC